MDCDFCSFLLPKEECEKKVGVGGCSKKSTLVYFFSRRKADSLEKEWRDMMQATGSFAIHFQRISKL